MNIFVFTIQISFEIRAKLASIHIYNIVVYSNVDIISLLAHLYAVSCIAPADTCRNLFIIISSMNKKWPQLCGACWGTCLHLYSTCTFINDSYVSDNFAGHKVQMCGKKRRLKVCKEEKFS